MSVCDRAIRYNYISLLGREVTHEQFIAGQFMLMKVGDEPRKIWTHVKSVTALFGTVRNRLTERPL